MFQIVKIIIITIICVVDITLVFYGLYFFFTGIFAFKKMKKIKKYNPKHKIAVLVAARNEEKVIGHLVKSLKKQKYPEELYEVFILPNNCTDNTATVAEEAGAKIIDCSNWQTTCKGEVLRHAFEYMNIHHSEYEAYCIFDADNVVDSNFIARMNDAMCEGYKVVQGNREIKNPYDNWVSNCYALIYLTQNIFFNRARINSNRSSFINGTGFLVSKESVDEFGFETHTMTEDAEFTGQCALNGIKIGFVKDAITFDEQPIKFSQSWKQRMRWSMGTFGCIKHYFIKLIKTGIKTKNASCIDIALFYIAPIVQILTLVGLILNGILVISETGIDNLSDALITSKIYGFAGNYMFCCILAYIVLRMSKKSILKSLKGIFTFSIFMLTWLPINVICLFKKKHKWEKIEHTRSIDLETLVS